MRATNDCTRGKEVVPGILVHCLKLKGTQSSRNYFYPRAIFADTALASSSYFIIFMDSFSALNLYTELSMRINVRVD